MKTPQVAGHWCKVCKRGPLFSWETKASDGSIDGFCPKCRAQFTRLNRRRLKLIAQRGRLSPFESRELQQLKRQVAGMVFADL